MSKKKKNDCDDFLTNAQNLRQLLQGYLYNSFAIRFVQKLRDTLCRRYREEESMLHTNTQTLRTRFEQQRKNTKKTCKARALVPWLDVSFYPTDFFTEEARARDKTTWSCCFGKLSAKIY